MKKSLFSFGAILIVCLILSSGPAYGFDFSKLENQVSEHTLENGLKVLVMERHHAPVVSLVTWCNVGSADDPKGYTGLAHMFEHMAFKGSSTLGTKDIDKELELIAIEDSIFMELRTERNKGRMADSVRIAALEKSYEEAREASYELVVPNEFGNVVDREGGVGLNAFTSMDVTAYMYSLPSNKAELWFALESARFKDPVLREMYKERDVVAEERRMRIESNPIGRLIEEFQGLAFKAHPYGVTGVGHMSDINFYSRQEADAFRKKYYVPSNMVVSIVGDVKAKDIFKLAEKYFGEIPYSPPPPRIATVEPEQIGERRMVIEDPSQPFYIVGWHIPEGTHPDRPALDALIDYLASGRTSILYKRLVKEQKAALQVAAFAGYPGDKYPSMLAAYALPTAEHTNQEIEDAIFKAVEELRTELIPDEEVAKIKARAKAQFINQMDSNMGLAMQLATYQTSWGNWRELFRTLDGINAVTAEDIQRVAKQYMTMKNRNVGQIVTEES
ncbi:MAG: pitrilysin family protein [bacterium]|nr:pitrilysin family protein [bacterium]